MARYQKKFGIFCIEGDWYGDMRRPTSVEPALALLRTANVSGIPYIHRNVVGPEDFKHYIHKWLQKKFDAYPLLYIGLHGSRGYIHVGDGRSPNSKISLDHLQQILKKSTRQKNTRMIHFGSCGTLAVHGNRVQRFLSETGLLATFGYSTDIDWMDSAFFDTMLFYRLLRRGHVTPESIQTAVKETKARTGRLSKMLSFKHIVRP